MKQHYTGMFQILRFYVSFQMTSEVDAVNVSPAFSPALIT